MRVNRLAVDPGVPLHGAYRIGAPTPVRGPGVCNHVPGLFRSKDVLRSGTSGTNAYSMRILNKCGDFDRMADTCTKTTVTVT
jgi:hypothetical protein